MQLSICIPTYNRHNELQNCLESIYQSYLKFKKIKFEICISDNSENNKNKLIVRLFRKKFKKKVQVKYNKFEVNKGDVIPVPDGAFHRVFNESDELLEFAAVFNGERHTEDKVK